MDPLCFSDVVVSDGLEVFLVAYTSIGSPTQTNIGSGWFYDCIPVSNMCISLHRGSAIYMLMDSRHNTQEDTMVRQWEDYVVNTVLYMEHKQNKFTIA